MTAPKDPTPAEDRSDLGEATRLVKQSQQRAEAEQARAYESARVSWSWAHRLRRLREENGFDRLMDEAYGGGRG